MARQYKARQGKNRYDDRHYVKCGVCGCDTKRDNITVKRIRGIAKWICSACSIRIEKVKNGV